MLHLCVDMYVHMCVYVGKFGLFLYVCTYFNIILDYVQLRIVAASARIEEKEYFAYCALQLQQGHRR